MRKCFPAATALVIIFGPLTIGTTSPDATVQDGSAALIARIEARQSPSRQGLDPYTIQELMQKLRITGMSVAVIKDSAIHWAKGYGVADVESGRPVERDTMFQAASISKPVTAMAVLKAVQDGRLSIDVDVNQILKSWKVPPSEWTSNQPVTLRSLLSHTSGADDGFGFPGYAPSQPRPTVPQILNGEKPSNVGAVLFARPPFVGYKYSGGGFTIVQLALMDVTGKPFADIMQASVLDPLEMKDSTYEQPLPTGRKAKAARAHSGQGRAMDADWHIYPEQAAAGLWTTPSDLARFAIEVQRALEGPRGRVLSQALAREMITPTGVGGFAVGLGIEKRAEGWYFSHGGSNWGFRCTLVAHVCKGYGVVVMTNSDSGGAILNEIESRVASVYGWESLDKPIPR